jgi:hypothetical protein
MTRLFILFTAFATIVGLFYFRSAQREQLQRISAAEAAAQEAHARASDADQLSDRLKREMLKLQAEELLRPHAITPLTNSTTEKAEHPAARLFRDPEMRAAMRREQMNAVQQNVNRIVDSNLVAALNLTPEQSAALKDLVQKKHAPGVDLMIALMSSDASELPAIGTVAQQQRDTADAEIRSFLGEPAYGVFNAYEDSLPERLQLSRLQRHFDKGGLTLAPEQEASLLQAMIEERQNSQFTHDFHDPMKFDMNRLPEIFGEQSLDQFIRETEQLNERIILRAQSILGPEQSGQFAQSLRDHFERSKVTVKLTAALFPVGRKN